MDFDFRIEIERKQGSVYDGFVDIFCEGNRICGEVYNKMKKLKPTNIIVFQAYKAVDKSGTKVEIRPLALHIK